MAQRHGKKVFSMYYIIYYFSMYYISNIIKQYHQFSLRVSLIVGAYK